MLSFLSRRDLRRQDSIAVSHLYFYCYGKRLTHCVAFVATVQDSRGGGDGRCRESFATRESAKMEHVPVAKGSRHHWGATPWRRERLLDFWLFANAPGGPINVVQKSAGSARRDRRFDRENPTFLALIEPLGAIDFWTFGNWLDRSKSPWRADAQRDRRRTDRWSAAIGG